MPRFHDTIAALSTPNGTAALAVLRISGVDTARIAAELYGRSPAPRMVTHIDYRDLAGNLLDDVLVTFFAAPRSYTGEDTLEISAHGNPFIARKILEDLFARGCRPAEAGEFTQRAFLNGRMDLSEAEAVMDLIQARSERALHAANAQLRGALRQRMEPLVERLLGALARVEAYIDFPDEDLPNENKVFVGNEIRGILSRAKEIGSSARYGEMLRDGVKTVIVGAPNAGKSSLLNALVGHERALVSPEPGTTRDFIEERLIVGPHWLRLIDTAGLNPTPGEIEAKGIEKTAERVREADLVLLVLDASLTSAPPLPSWLSGLLTEQTTRVVLNKSDLPSLLPRASLPEGLPAVAVSATTGAGLEALRCEIAHLIDRSAPTVDLTLAVSARHADALRRAREGLEAASAKLASNEPSELIASDLRDALAAFGEITGRIDNERMLDQLFATFCIGK
jgi:tRNA modification GTPase